MLCYLDFGQNCEGEETSDPPGELYEVVAVKAPGDVDNLLYVPQLSGLVNL